MPSADQVPVNYPHSMMQWHWWVVLIAGSTGSALRAVRPPNFHITPGVGATSFTPRARRVPDSARSWPSGARSSIPISNARFVLARAMSGLETLTGAVSAPFDRGLGFRAVFSGRSSLVIERALFLTRAFRSSAAAELVSAAARPDRVRGLRWRGWCTPLRVG